jgi:16S rRNA (cytidine1402-2'-O)-methyltransferase
MLYLVATPIGNLGDISLRALEVLKNVDYILAEDTRNIGLLLKNLGIENKAKLISFYDEVEEQKTGEILKLLDDEKEVALVSDAGSPLISDPGYKLIKRCRKLNYVITSVPGPSALINALILSGLATAHFSFLGFLSKKSGARLKLLKEYKQVGGSKIVYESPFRVKKLLEEIKSVYGKETKVSVCREMTKKFEEVISGEVDEVIEKIGDKKIKGEVVVVFT